MVPRRDIANNDNAFVNVVRMRLTEPSIDEKKRQLHISPVPNQANGDCLFIACAHGLGIIPTWKLTDNVVVKEMRRRCAIAIDEHPDRVEALGLRNEHQKRAYALTHVLPLYRESSDVHATYMIVLIVACMRYIRACY